MFSKKITDIKKSAQKIQDPKKDLATRVKHLKVILCNYEHIEAKGFFEANFSHIYQILYEAFVQAEQNLRQKELTFHLVQRATREELDVALWILEQVLILLPELIHKRWQLHSLGRLLSKLLHPGNTAKLRKQAIKYFLMWYQALNENAPDHVHHMFASLVAGFIPISAIGGQTSNSVFHDTSSQYPVTPGDLLPIYPAQSNDTDNKVYMEALLDGMASTVVKLEWHDKEMHQRRSFQFLLERFQIHYLPKLCPNFSYQTSLYKPILDLPTRRKAENENEFVAYRVILIKWVINYTHKRGENANVHTQAALQQVQDDEGSEQSSLDGNMSLQSVKTAPSELEQAAQVVRDVLWSSRDNINFIHELYRQAFLLNFDHIVAIRKTIAMYKDIVQKSVPDMPPYMLEPVVEENARTEDGEPMRPPRLRNDSYLGAIQKENLLVRAGLQNVLQLFMTHAGNVFLLEVNPHLTTSLEEQTDACKRVLNIYRYMVMHTRMDSETWEQLLLVLLQITSLVLGENPPPQSKKKIGTLGGKLAPAIFQTLIVTWIKANLNVMISRELWDRFLHVLTSLTNWEELITEWSKTLETLTRVLARQVYNLDLTNLPLDRLSEQKSKKRPRVMSKTENSSQMVSTESHQPVDRHDSSAPEEAVVVKTSKPGLSRSFSETNLSKRRTFVRASIYIHKSHRRAVSLDNLRQQIDTESTDRTRTPSPAPSSGLESTSMKDAPIPLDVLSGDNHQLDVSGENRGVVCGGSIRGWLPDVAVILWRRMLGALGDVNEIADSHLHSQVFEYLVKLVDTLIKIKANQGVTIDNISTPSPPELVPPLTLIVPWCFGALNLSPAFDAGKINALRLLCIVTINCDPHHRSYLPHFYRSLHFALSGSSRPILNVTLRYLGARFLSLQLPGSSLLLLDLVHACSSVLNSSDLSEATPRSEAISILGGLLSMTGNLNKLSVLRPESSINVLPCPDIKEHIVGIVLKTGRREPTGLARCSALTVLGHFVYREFTNESYSPLISEAINVILQSLKLTNKIIAQLASNTLYLLCDHGVQLWLHYPRLADSIIRSLCHALFLHTPSGPTASESEKSLSTSLLLCLGEWCMKLGPQRLLMVSEYGENKTCLLLLVFSVLHRMLRTKSSEYTNLSGLVPPQNQDDFDSHISLDNLPRGTSGNTKTPQHRQAIILCARTVLSHLVTHLGHFPMAIGAARLSSLVVEHDDVPALNSDELSMDIFAAPNIQLFVLTANVIASLVELPALDLPGGGVTAGLSTADKQVRVLLRDLSGKASWDASILYKTPEMYKNYNQLRESTPSWSSTNSSKWGPMSIMQHESLCPVNIGHTNIQQRAMRHRNPNVLPNTENSAPDLDQLDDLLQYLGHTSPEILENGDHSLNIPALSPLDSELEAEAIGSVISERNIEIEQSRTMQNSNAMLGHPACRPESRESDHLSHETNSQQSAFQQCRLLFSQLGLAGWERRKQLHLLNKNERLLRELKNLDGQRCRETHKVAVIYVAPGQEDKNSILSNQCGSMAYEQFLAALAWEVELEAHTGFLGGLQRQGSTGLTAPYVASSFMEAIFHVATRMPGDTPEAVLNKTRHLGNDEVHVVWSEHSRDYRRDIIPTEFCDILISIYPLSNHLNRVTINCKPDVPMFGVLFDEAIIEDNILAGVVRTAIICASRAKRSTMSFYQQYYEERSQSLQTVVNKYRNATTYEDLIARVYIPMTMPSNFNVGIASVNEGDGVTSVGSNSSPSAAAWLDIMHNPHKSGSKEIAKFRDGRGVWFNNVDISQNVESTSISPRPLKKLTSLKNAPRRSLRSENNTGSETPPQSPNQFLRKK